MRSPTAAFLEALAEIWGKPSSATAAPNGIQVTFHLPETLPSNAVMQLMCPQLRIKQATLLKEGDKQGRLVLAEGYGTSATLTFKAESKGGTRVIATVLSPKGLLNALVESVDAMPDEYAPKANPGNVVSIESGKRKSPRFGNK